MFQDIFGLRDELDVFLREKHKEDFDLWKKGKVKKQESVKNVEPFDLDKAYENALSEVRKTVEYSYNRRKLRLKGTKYQDVPSCIKTEEFSWSWVDIVSPLRTIDVGNGIGRLDTSISGSTYINPLDVIDKKYIEDKLGIIYLPIFPRVKLPVRVTEAPKWLKKVSK